MEKNFSCIAFFDFDGTITNKDSFLDFVKIAVGSLRFYTGFIFIFPLILGIKIKLISPQRAKEQFLFYFFKRWTNADFQQLARQYSLNQMKNILIPQALEKIKWHQENKHEVVIVSASLESWLSPWCLENNIQLISSRLDIKSQYFSGKLDGLNCNGLEKVKRIKSKYDLSRYDLVYAYGNSKEDKAMLELANKKFYKYF